MAHNRSASRHYRNLEEYNPGENICCEELYGLPQEMVREILMRTSHKSCYSLKAVCKTWKTMLECPRFYEDRMRFGFSKDCICMLQILHDKCEGFEQGPIVTIYDPVHKLWDRLPPIPTGFEFFYFSKCICLEGRLVLLGGLDQRIKLSSKRKRLEINTILVYDFSSSTWRQGTNNPIPTTYFACSASPDGLIYIAGGRNRSGVTGEAAVYNVKEDKWVRLPNMLQTRVLCDGVFMDNMFYVLGLYDDQVERFDPKTGVWSTLENKWFMEDCLQPLVAAFGRLYCFGWEAVMEYDCKDYAWREVDDLPQPLDRVRATVWEDGFFVSGLESGTNTAIFYMYRPSVKIWISIDRPENFPDSWVQDVGTIVI